MKTIKEMNLIFPTRQAAKDFREKTSFGGCKLKYPKQASSGAWFIPEGLSFGKTLSLHK